MDKLTHSVMQRISRGTISRAEAAARLNVSERSVNRLMKKYGVSRPVQPKGKYRSRHEATMAKRARQKEIIEAIHDWHDVPHAAWLLDLSERQVYRLIKKYKREVA
jgi:transposase